MGGCMGGGMVVEAAAISQQTAKDFFRFSVEI